jgi:HlyD family secretion protein
MSLLHQDGLFSGKKQVNIYLQRSDSKILRKVRHLKIMRLLTILLTGVVRLLTGVVRLFTGVVRLFTGVVRLLTGVVRLLTRVVRLLTGVEEKGEGRGAEKGEEHGGLGWVGVIGVLAVFVLGGAFLGALGACGQTDRGDEARPLAVGTAQVRVAKVTQTVTYVGTVHSETEVAVLARVAGRVSALPFGEGDQVKKGQVVARLDSQDLAAGVEQSAAQVRGARAEKQYRCHWAGVHKGLAKKGYLSRSKAAAGLKACRAARAQLRAARAARRKTAALKAKTVERAPFDAVVLRESAERGENMLPGRPLLTLGGAKKEIRVWVTQEDVNTGISPEAGAILESEGVVERTEVTRVAPQANPRTHLFEVGIAVPKRLGQRFRHGSAVTVHFVVQESKGLVVPVESVRRVAGRLVVYRIHEGRAQAVEVEEIFRNEEQVRVRGALAAGDLLAVTNLSSLRDKLAVLAVSRIVGEGRAAGSGR